MKMYKVSEIFYSINGEGPSSGLKTVFIRLAGCNLFKYGGCKYCDTLYAQDTKSGTNMNLNEIMKQVQKAKNCKRALITGGEPLTQNIEPLLEELWHLGYSTEIETNGSINLFKYFEKFSTRTFYVAIVMDIKTPCSGMESKMCFKNLGFLNETDAVKFVCRSAADVHYAESVLKENSTLAGLYVSSVWGTPWLKEIAEAVKVSRYSFRLQTQLHKVIWGNKRGV